MIVQEGNSRKEISTLIVGERREPPPLAKKSQLKEGELRSYFKMPDGSLVFDQAKLAETIESYRHYAR